MSAPKNKPIIVTNPNDPRLKAYQDSLNLFNISRQNELIFNKDPFDSRLYNYKEKVDKLSKKSKINPYKYKQGWSNEDFSEFPFNSPEADYYLQSDVPYMAIFKKPIQSYEYDPNIPLMPKRPINRKVEPDLLKTKVNSIGLPLSSKLFTDYSGSYMDQPQVAPKTDGTVYTDNELAKMGYRGKYIKPAKASINKYAKGGEVTNNTSWFNQDLVRQANERMNAPSTTTLGKVLSKTGAKDNRAKYLAKNPNKYNIEDYKQGHQEAGLEPIPLEAMLLPGTPVIKGLGKLGNFALDAMNPLQGMRNINKVAPHLSVNAKSALSHEAASPIIYNAGTSAMGGIMPVMNEAVFGDGDANPEELLKNMGIGAGLGYLGGNMFRNKQVKKHYKNHGTYYDNYDENRKKWAIRSQKLKDELSSLETLMKAKQQAAKEGVTNQPDMWGFKKTERQATFDAQTAKDLARIKKFTTFR
jgi:hypothetical protein